ncbi:hypothetical protein [Rufibacter immobilis]
MSADQIQQWRGELDFVHRVKIMVLRDFIQQHEGTVLYLDTDTVITGSLDHIFSLLEDGKSYVMHENEGPISSRKNSIFKKVDTFLRNTSTGISPDTPMNNAGVLGFRSSDKQMLDDVLATTDRLYQLYQKHIIEQLAFSFHMNKLAQKPVYTATQEIFHYWDFKEFRGVLNVFFRHFQGQRYQRLVEHMELIQPQKLILPKRAYESLPFFSKAWRKLSGKLWNIPPYQLP